MDFSARHKATHVADLGMLADGRFKNLAARAKRNAVIISKDEDFADRWGVER